MSKFGIVINNGRVWDGEKMLDCDSVAVADGKIAEIGKNLMDADFVFDANGAIIAPGLIDIHTHIKGCSPDLFGVPIEAVAYPFGVTTVVEAATGWNDGKTLLDNMLLNSYVFAATGIKNDTADLSSTVKIIEVYKEKVLGVKVFFDTTNEGVKSIKPLKEICDFAHSKNLKVMVHSTNSPVPMSEVVGVLEKGDICTHIFHGGKNTVLDDEFLCMNKAKEKGIILDNGMAGGVHTDFSVARKAIEKGFLPDTISTDVTKMSAFIRGGVYGITLCMSIMRTLGMEEDDILRCVTSSAAEAIGRDDICGRLIQGRRADISVISYTEAPFDMSSNWSDRVKGAHGYKNQFTVIDGKVMYRV